MPDPRQQLELEVACCVARLGSHGLKLARSAGIDSGSFRSDGPRSIFVAVWYSDLAGRIRLHERAIDIADALGAFDLFNAESVAAAPLGERWGPLALATILVRLDFHVAVVELNRRAPILRAMENQ